MAKQSNGVIHTDFWATQLGRATSVWEQNMFDACCEGAFGYYALNLGQARSVYDPLRQCAVSHHLNLGSNLRMELEDWPFQNDSLDYITLPHILETTPDPHALLREAARCLRPGGVIVITAFNPHSLLAMRRQAAGLNHPKHWITRGRLLDWLRLLDLHPDRGAFGHWRPPCATVKQFDRLAWMDAAGERWWPHMANVFALRVIKRVLPDVRRLGRQSRLKFAHAPAHQNAKQKPLVIERVDAP